MLLRDDVCVVTGAGRGIGRHTAEAFAREGGNLALCARSIHELQEVERAIKAAFDVEVLVEAVDISDPDAVQAFADLVENRFSRVDVLVNNAGTYGPVGPLIQVNLDDWLRAIEVNLYGTVYSIRAFAPLMIKGGGGRIINVAGGGIGGANAPSNVGAYTASKAAVVLLTETLAKELAPYHIWVNAVAPGAISTRLIDAVIDAGPALAGAEFYRASLEQRAGGDPAEKVGEAMVFLAGGRSSNLTGKLLSAKWDDLDRISGDIDRVNAASLFTLRRIDGALFAELSGPP